MADHTVLGHPRRPYIMLKIEKIQLVENRQTEHREKNREVNYRYYSIP